jgi:tetrahydromethanopterin S-methyltransferase subunit H
MFKFKTPQKIYEIRGKRIGGQPGELPATLIGSIFYEGHKIVEDQKKGIFDRTKAEELIEKQDELSDLTGNPCMLDVVCTSIEAARSYIDFVSEATEAPILLDAYPKVRLEALEYVTEVGLTDRIVYNSIYSPSDAEVESISDSGIEAAILLAYNVEDRTTEGVLSILRGTDENPGLLEISERAGITKPLVDTTIFTYIPSIGMGARACLRVKEELGLPAGGAPGNATAVWKQPEDWGSDVAKVNYVAPQMVPLVLGADFLLYGVIEAAPWVFPSCAAVEAMIASTAQIEYGIETLTDEHPLYKMFPEFVEKMEKARRA